ncbi:TonB-dependent siderophore receptor [Achromobacter marplatensis]|uniref:TonB-dependent siderophore receptor n=1 Tax=Achromobacter marplatensis TaxID=470868 RepID=UPI000277FDFC|nr:TonB-dependent receptor [Achromobacter marplatensis]EJO32124.1 Fe(3+)-pyochelin receptor 1 [Achromobacter marplatensis]
MQGGKLKGAIAGGAMAAGVRGKRLPQPMPISVLAACVVAATAAPEASRAQAVQQQEYSIEAQPLDRALRLFSEQSRHQVLFDEAVVTGRQAPAVQGKFTPREALDRLLAGSGVIVNSARPDVFTLTRITGPAADSSGAVTLQAVTVTGQGERTATTEQTGSYTSPALTLGKWTQSIRETPQSVSVITRQQLDDRNLTTLEEALAQTTGVTKSARNFGNHKFSIRGFNVDNANYMIDGVPGTVYAPVGWLPVDTAVFDRVEVLRGAGGLVLGAADPSGAINMVRKRPRGEAHLEMAGSVGSWDNYRGELDAGGPLNADGTVRARFVTAYQDRHFFYDGSASRAPLLYGVIDADVGPNTLLTFGARRQESTTDGYWLFGLPRYTDGGALDVSRSTSLIQDWNRQKGGVSEVFAEAEHRFAGDWKAKVSYNHTITDLDQRVAIPVGGVDRATGIGSSFYDIYFNRMHLVSDGIDANTTGSFRALGRTHQVLVGANWSRQRTGQQSADLTANTPIDVFNPDHSSIPEPERPDWDSRSSLRETQYGLYANARLQLADPLHLILGGRLSWLEYRADDDITGRKTADYQQKHEFTPYAGLVYDLDNQWSVYTSYADTFQPQSSYVTSSGTPLDPAIGANYEAGVKGELYDGRLNVSAAVFAIRKSGLAVVDENIAASCPGSLASRDCYRNGGNLRSKGFELEASGELAPGWQVMAGYTYLTSKDDEGQSISAETPRHLLRLSTSYQLPGKWNAVTIGGGVSAQSGYSYPAYDDTSVRMGAPGRAVWDLRAAYRFNRHWTAAVNVANVFDKSYYGMISQIRRGNHYGEPRNVMLTVRGTF